MAQHAQEHWDHAQYWCKMIPLVPAGLLQSKGTSERYLLSLSSRQLSLVTQPTIHLVAMKYQNS